MADEPLWGIPLLVSDLVPDGEIWVIAATDEPDSDPRVACLSNVAADPE